MKKFILGFITGGIICATLTGFAVEYAVTVNPFPVKVNGVETSIEGYNINDNTYFKLRDVADAVGGFDVGFTDNTITIDTAAVCPMPIETPTASSTPAPTAVIDVSDYIVKGDDGKDYTTDGLEVEYVDGVAYIDVADIQYKFVDKGFNNYVVADNSLVDINTFEKLITDISRCPNDYRLISLNDYITKILPFINEL